MIVTEPRILEDNKFVIEPPVKKMRSDSGSSEHNIESPVTVRNLELESVKTLFQDYDLLESEAVSCVICGKNFFTFSIKFKSFGFFLDCEIYNHTAMLL